MACAGFGIFFWFISMYYTQHLSGQEYSNVALGKPTKQAQEWYGGLASNAVDGNRNPAFFSYSCTHTHEGSNTWWVVDLLDSYQIHSIVITNRDYDNTRLRDFYVYISDINPLPIPSTDGSCTGQLCLFHSGALAPSGPHALLCDDVIIGRYVYVYKPPNQALTMCEFEVMAAPYDAGGEMFFHWPGRKSTLSPFHSTTMKVPASITKCAFECLVTSGGVTTVVQFRQSTRSCDCIEKSSLTISGIDYTLDSDWALMESTGN